MSKQYRITFVIVRWLACLWVGAYIHGLIPVLNWQWWSVPYCITGFVFGVTSIFATLLKIVSIEGEKS